MGREEILSRLLLSLQTNNPLAQLKCQIPNWK